MLDSPSSDTHVWPAAYTLHCQHTSLAHWKATQAQHGIIKVNSHRREAAAMAIIPQTVHSTLANKRALLHTADTLKVVTCDRRHYLRFTAGYSIDSCTIYIPANTICSGVSQCEPFRKDARQKFCRLLYLYLLSWH